MALRRLRLAHPAGRRRQRRRRDRRGHRGRRGGRPAEPHRRPHPHRLRQPEQAGHPEGARRPARPGRGPAHQGGLRLGPGPHVLRAGRGRGRVPPRRSTTGKDAGRRLGGALRRLRAPRSRPRPPSCARRARRGLRRRLGRGPPDVRGRHRGRDPQRQPGRHPGAGRARCRSCSAASADLSESNLTDVKAPATTTSRPSTPGATCASACASTRWAAIANGIAYHGGLPPLRRDVPHLQRLHARLGAARRAVRPARDLRLDPRLRRASARTGPTHQPVEHYAALRAIPNLWFVRPGRRERGGGGVGAGGRAADDRGRASGPSRSRSPARSCRRCRARASWRARASRRGGYVLREAAGGAPQLILIGTGSELQLAFAAAETPRGRGHPDARREPPLLGAVRGPGRRPTATRSCRRP